MGKQPIDQVQLLFLLLILCLPNSIFKLATSTNINIILCPEVEKEALLSFKQSLEDPSNILSSWNRSSNCCSWKGVVCSNITGSVHQLHLQGGGWYSNSTLQGKIDPSLLQLKHLKYLDLSRNNIYERIPSFFGSLTSLEYLNLSGAGFYGKIPPTIGNLSRLHTLDLDTSSVDGRRPWGLDVDSLEWLRGLSQLQHLDMTWVNLTKAGGKWMQVMNALPFLVELRLTSCGLDFNLDPLMMSELVNITSLEILDLDGNPSSFPIPNWIFRQSNLVFLDLSGNDFKGPIPIIINITKLPFLVELHLRGCGLDHLSEVNITSLEILDLSFNYIYGSFPDWIFRQRNLVFLDLSGNYFQGSIPTITNITKLQHLDLSRNGLNSAIPDWLHSCKDLTTLDLSRNQLSGEIQSGILNLCKLQMLDLSHNMLQGEIPETLGRMSDCLLRGFHLSYNRLTGNLPMSVGQLSNLEVLDIGNNKMSGFVTESHFANLTKLASFAASGNHLTLKLSSNWTPPFNLTDLKLGSWNLGAGSDIPLWLEMQKSSLNELDISNTGISGNVPAWFWEIRFLNLSYNHFSGNIPDTLDGNLRGLYLNSNQFSGPLPQLGNNNLIDINLSNNSFSGGISHFLCGMSNHNPLYENALMNLNLGGNQLTGEIPKCWMKFPSLTVLNLCDNNFSGGIPISIGALTYLFSLNLRNNKLSGKIPIAISNCTQLVTMDLSGNDLVGNIPTEIGTSLANLRLLILRSNKLRGTIPWSICHLNSLQIFDLSNNAFMGTFRRVLTILLP